MFVAGLAQGMSMVDIWDAFLVYCFQHSGQRTCAHMRQMASERIQLSQLRPPRLNHCKPTLRTQPTLVSRLLLIIEEMHLLQCKGWQPWLASPSGCTHVRDRTEHNMQTNKQQAKMAP